MKNCKVTDKTIELIEKSLKNIDYNCEIYKKENNGENWEINFFDFKIIVYHTGKTNFQKIKGGIYSQEEEFFLTDLIINVIKYNRVTYSEENLKYVQLINDLRNEESAEGTYFEFKQQYSDTRKIVKELMSLLNNIEDREAYLIFGIDDNKNIVGVSKENSINEDSFNDEISKLIFGYGHLKDAISFKDVQYRERRLQVIICNRYKFIPIYIDGEFPEKFKKLKGEIYTRVGGSNTIASYRDMKKLWELHRKRNNE